MTTTTVCNVSRHVQVPCIRRVDPARPFAWLKAGALDFVSVWPVSLAYGLVIAGLSYLLVNSGWTRPALALTLTIAFLLIGAFLAVGFYGLSLRRERELAGGAQTGMFTTLRGNLGSIGLFVVLLAFVVSVWERISAILVGLYLGSNGVPDASLSWLFSLEHPWLLLGFGGFTVLLALAVFSLSVVSLPMLMDRQVDLVTALVTSLWVVWENRLAMVVWAVLIVVLTTLGVLTWFVGLAVIFPILGHATWHAYRELVE
jgi:uncharacterized membrane protein